VICPLATKSRPSPHQRHQGSEGCAARERKKERPGPRQASRARECTIVRRPGGSPGYHPSTAFGGRARSPYRAAARIPHIAGLPLLQAVSRPHGSSSIHRRHARPG
jgi:hypothetical protein